MHAANLHVREGRHAYPPTRSRDPADDGLVVLESSLLRAAGFQHAFFGRTGGASAAPLGLTFAARTDDELAAVRANVRLAAGVLGVDPGHVYFLSQVHGCASAILDGTESYEEVVRRVGDITASRAPGVACGVRSADCVPVLLGDRRSGAVAAVHSGWRGTEARAVGAGIAALRAIAGAAAEIVAAIGPHIEACCFEVGADVALRLAACSSAGDAAVTWAAARDASSGAARVDLRRIVRAQLVALGVADDAIEDVRGCTFCDPERFHSFRRDAERSGRMLSAIVARRAAPAGAV